MGNSQMAERDGVNCRPCGVPLPPTSDWSDLRQENFPFWGRCHVFQNGLYYRPVNESGNYLCPNCFEEPRRRQEEQQRRQEEEQRRRESERKRREEQQIMQEEEQRRRESERKRREEQQRMQEEEQRRRESERRKRQEQRRRQEEEQRRRESERKRREENELQIVSQSCSQIIESGRLTSIEELKKIPTEKDLPDLNQVLDSFKGFQHRLKEVLPLVSDVEMEGVLESMLDPNFESQFIKILSEDPVSEGKFNFCMLEIFYLVRSWIRSKKIRDIEGFKELVFKFFQPIVSVLQSSDQAVAVVLCLGDALFDDEATHELEQTLAFNCCWRFIEKLEDRVESYDCGVLLPEAVTSLGRLYQEKTGETTKIFCKIRDILSDHSWLPYGSVLIDAFLYETVDEESLSRSLDFIKCNRLNPLDWGILDGKKIKVLDLLEKCPKSSQLPECLEKTPWKVECTLEQILKDLVGVSLEDQDLFLRVINKVSDWRKTIENNESQMASELAAFRHEPCSPSIDTEGFLIRNLKHAMLVVHKCKGFWVRIAQMLCFCVMMLGKHHKCLLKVLTGEGKSCVIAMVAAIAARTGRKVDIITSSPLLAKRDAVSWKEFFREMGGLNSSHNVWVAEDEHKKKAVYNCDIVYGTVASFAADFLQSNFERKDVRGNRDFDMVIVDEVDSLLVDCGVQVTYLSHSNAGTGMRHLEPLLSLIWMQVTNAMTSEYEDEDADASAVEEVDQNSESESDADEDEDKESVNVEHLVDHLCDALKKKVPGVGEQVVDDQIEVPNYLREFAHHKIRLWIRQAILAITMKQGRQYAVENDAIVPIDFASTGVMEINKQWGDGLQQFLEMKHRLALSPLSLVTNFMSNVFLFKQYKSIFGLSGTLGLESEKLFISEVYGCDKFIEVPPNSPRKLLECEGILAGDEDEWKQLICQRIREEAIEKQRAVLVITEYVNTCNFLKEEIERTLNVPVTACSNSLNQVEMKELESEMSTGKVVVATNLAGRGADIAVSEEVAAVGGLHVLVTFLPSSLRVERQAFGRSARKGKPGSAQIIAMRTQTTKDCINLLKAKQLRDQMQSSKITEILEKDVPKVLAQQDAFKCYCDMLNDCLSSIEWLKISHKDNEEGILSSLHEMWAMWLTMKSDSDLLNLEQLRLDLKNLFNDGIQRLQKKESPMGNPYHLLQFGGNCLLQHDTEMALEFYESVIRMNGRDELVSGISGYMKAFCLIELQAENYLENAMKELKISLDKLKLFKSEVASVSVFVGNSGQARSGQSLPVKEEGENSGQESSVREDNSFSRFINARVNVIENWEKSIKKGMKSLQGIMDAGANAKVSTKSLLTIASSEGTDGEALRELSEMGLFWLFDIEKKPEFCWSALAVFCLGILQVVAGSLVIALSAGTMIQVGAGLISEGVSDCIEGISGMVTGEFSWEEWGISKAISIAVSLATAGIGKFVTSAAKGLKGTLALKNCFKDIAQKPAEQVCRKSLKESCKAAGKTIRKEIVSQGVTFGVNFASEKILDELQEKIASAAKPEIEKKLSRKFREPDLNGPIMSLLDYYENTEKLEPIRAAEETKNCVETVGCDIVADFLHQPGWEKHGFDFLQQLSHRLSDNERIGQQKKLAKGFSAFNWLLKAFDATACAVGVSRLSAEFCETLAARLQKICDEKSMTHETHQDQGENERPVRIGHELHVKIKLIKNLIESLSNKLFEEMCSSVRKRIVNHATQPLKSYVSENLRKNLMKKTRSIKERIAPAKTKPGHEHEHEAEAKKKESPHHKPGHEQERTPAAQHAEAVRSEKTEGGWIELKALAESRNINIIVHKVDEHGRPISEKKGIIFYPEKPGASNPAIHLEYSVPTDSALGHYRPRIDGKPVDIESSHNNCLFAAAAHALSHHSGIKVNHMQLREEAANRIERNPERFNAKVQEKAKKKTLDHMEKELWLIGGNLQEKRNKKKQKKQSQRRCKKKQKKQYQQRFKKKQKKQYQRRCKKEQKKNPKKPGHASEVLYKIGTSNEMKRQRKMTVKKPVSKTVKKPVSKTVQDHMPAFAAVRDANAGESPSEVSKFFANKQKFSSGRGGLLTSMIVREVDHKEFLTTGQSLGSNAIREMQKDAMKENKLCEAIKLTAIGSQNHWGNEEMKKFVSEKQTKIQPKNMGKEAVKETVDKHLKFIKYLKERIDEANFRSERSKETYKRQAEEAERWVKEGNYLRKPNEDPLVKQYLERCREKKAEKAEKKRE